MFSFLMQAIIQLDQNVKVGAWAILEIWIYKWRKNSIFGAKLVQIRINLNPRKYLIPSLRIHLAKASSSALLSKKRVGREGSIESQQKFDFFCSDIMPYSCRHPLLINTSLFFLF